MFKFEFEVQSSGFEFGIWDLSLEFRVLNKKISKLYANNVKKLLKLHIMNNVMRKIHKIIRH